MYGEGIVKTGLGEGGLAFEKKGVGFLVFVFYAGDAAEFFKLPECALEKVAVFGEGLIEVGCGHGLRGNCSKNKGRNYSRGSLKNGFQTAFGTQEQHFQAALYAICLALFNYSQCAPFKPQP